MAKVKYQFLDLDPGSDGYINAANLPYGSTGTPLSDILADLTADGIIGMRLVNGSGTTLTVQPGEVTLDGDRYINAANTTIDIATDRREGGNIVTDTVYFVYAFVNVDGNLDYYFSEYEPLRDKYGNVATTYTRELAANPTFHPIDGSVARHIGQVYVTGSGNIAPFTRCWPGYCESNWASLPGNGNTATIYHALGFRPEFIDAVFSTSIDGSNAQPQTYHFSASTSWFSSTRIGIRVNGIDNDSVGIRQESNGAFIDVSTGATVSAGFVKVRMM